MEYQPAGREYLPPGDQWFPPAQEFVPPVEVFVSGGSGEEAGGKDAQQERRKKIQKERGKQLLRSMAYCVAAVVTVVTLGNSLRLSDFLPWEGDWGGVVENNVVSCVTSALTGSGLPATIRVREGSDTGMVVKTIRCDADGGYSLTLPAGRYVLEISASGYMTERFSREVFEGEGPLTDRYTLSPQLGPGEFRIVLEWGDRPSDLDSHLVGSSDRGDRVNLYYGLPRAQYYSSNGEAHVLAMLDRDDTDCYGPETTTIYNKNGVYSFLIHDFSNGESEDSLSLEQSGATVKVYRYGSDRPRVWTVPPGPGTWWHVFDIDHGILRDVNSRNVSQELKAR